MPAKKNASAAKTAAPETIDLVAEPTDDVKGERNDDDAELPENDKHSPERLFATWKENQAHYKPEVQVYRYVEGTGSRHASWCGEFLAAKLPEAVKEVSRLPNGGPGNYRLWLVDRFNGQKVKKLYADVKSDADLRPAGAATAGGETGMAGLVVALAGVLKPQANPIEQQIMARFLDDKTAMGTQLMAAYDQGWTAGMSRGRLEGGDAWKPKDVVDLVSQVRELIRPGAKADAQGSGGPNILQIFRVALDEGILPRQMLQVVRVFLGQGILVGLTKTMPEVLKASQEDPEARALLARDGANEWVLDFATQLQAETTEVPAP